MDGVTGYLSATDLLSPGKRVSGFQAGLSVFRQEQDALVDIASQGVYTGGAQGDSLGPLGSLVSAMAPESYSPGKLVNMLS